MPRNVRDYYAAIRRAFPRIKAAEAYGSAVTLAAADARDLVLVIQDEEERYELGDGETEYPRDVYWCAVYRASDVGESTGLPLRHASPLDSIGMVGTNQGCSDPYIQLCLRADLSGQALAELDREDAAHAADLAARGTYAAGGQ